MRPHRQQPTRLPHPWDSPGKNTGVGCHFPLQCMKAKSESEVTQSCPTLSDPMDGSPPGSFVHGIFQARVLEWGAIACSTQVAQWERIHLPRKETQGTRVQSLGLRRSPGKGNCNLCQHSSLENSMDRGAWQATVHGVTKSRIQLSMHTHTEARNQS